MLYSEYFDTDVLLDYWSTYILQTAGGTQKNVDPLLGPFKL